MTRIHSLATFTTGLLVTAAAAALFSAGSAAAVNPVVGEGGGGVWLSTQETDALAASPVPAVLEVLAPGPAQWIWLDEDSVLPHDGTVVVASDAQIISESAAQPTGQIGLLLLNPFSGPGGGSTIGHRPGLVTTRGIG